MSNNFRKMAVLKKRYELLTKPTQQRILLTNFGGLNCASEISSDACVRFSIYLSAIFPGKFSVVSKEKNFYWYFLCKS